MAAILSSCNFKEGIAAGTQIQQRVQSELGVESSVNVASRNGVETVSVHLKKLPSGPTATIRTRVEAIVKAEMPVATAVIITAAL